MGVHGLWQLLHPSGRPVTLESLEGKVLAVDVSIWLHQSMKGMRDKDGNALPNAHLQGLFSRVCKLLFYRIKPVFVFDGGIPDLKKQTLAARREKKSEAIRERDEIGKKLLQNLIKSQAVKQALGRGAGGSGGGGGSGPPVRVPGVSRKGDRDLFELPPLPEAKEVGLAMNSEAWDTDFEQQENWIKEGLSTLSKVDPDSAEFKSLPMEIQHEALVDLKEERKYHSLRRISKMPEDADNFSNYQLKKLMKVSNLTTRIDEVRKDMANRTTNDLRHKLGDGTYYGDQMESRRIVSEDASHYILIKGLTNQRQLEEAERYDLERKVKVEKEDDNNDVDGDGNGSGNKTEELQKDQETSSTSCSSSSKRPRQTRDKEDPVSRKRLKSTRGKGRGGGRGSGKNSRKGVAVLASTAVSVHKNSSSHNSDDDEEDDESCDEREQQDDVSEMSSSEDEGFIEVTFDPITAVQEDDLFPASIFANSDTNTTNTTIPRTITTITPSSITTTAASNVKTKTTKYNNNNDDDDDDGDSPKSSTARKSTTPPPLPPPPRSRKSKRLAANNKNHDTEERLPVDRSSNKSSLVRKDIRVKKEVPDIHVSTTNKGRFEESGGGQQGEGISSAAHANENEITQSSRAATTGGGGGASGEGKQNIADTRKSVLSDIMAELRRQKESMESLSVDGSGGIGMEEEEEEVMDEAGTSHDDDDDDDDDNNDVEHGGRTKGLSGRLSREDESNDIDDDDDDDKHGDEKNKSSGHEAKKWKGGKNVNDDEDFSKSGGFIRDESNSGDEKEEDVKRGENIGGKEIGDKFGNSCGKGKSLDAESDDDDDDDDDNDTLMTTSHEGRMYDSEDEDLKLAIELSLQTARQEKNDQEESTKKRVTFDLKGEDESLEVVSRGGGGGKNIVVDGGGGSKDGDASDDDDDDGDFEMVEEEVGEEEEEDDNDDVRNSFVTSAKQVNVLDEEECANVVSGTAIVATHVDDVDDCDDDDELLAATEAATSSPTKNLQERLQPEDVVDPFTEFQQSNLQNIREELAMERSGLLSEQGRQDRFATSLTDQIVLEAQELLNMFGIPYVVSPMEAEAQCAFLDATRQTQGTITDDSDIWLFGGARVYKNFFNQNKFVEFFSLDSVNSHFGLTREQLILIALLCGSDYTVGIPGVGPVRALEIMGEFQGQGLDGLRDFRKWWDKSHKKPAMPGENKLRARLKQLSLEGGFPSQRVLEAYLAPAVDESREKFSWGHPDLDQLRHFARMKFGWAKDKSDSILNPMMKQFLKTQSQGRIRSYFQSGSYVPSSTATAHSDRIKKALSVMQAVKSSTSSSPSKADTSSTRRDQGEGGGGVGGKNKNKKEKKMASGRKRRGAGDDDDESVDNNDDDDHDDGKDVNLPQKKTKTNVKKDSVPSEKNKNKSDKRQEREEEECSNSVSVKDKGIGSGLKAKGRNVKKNLVKKEKTVGEEKKSRDGVEGSLGSGGVVGESVEMTTIKTEPGVDAGGDGGFMKEMQEKVARAQSLLEKAPAAGKRGRGGGGGRGRGIRGGGGGDGCAKAKAKSAKSVRAGVPSLEKKGVKGGRGQRGNASTHSTTLKRGVVCLSESSSSSSSSNNDSDDDDDEDDDNNSNDYCHYSDFQLQTKRDEYSNTNNDKIVGSYGSSTSEQTPRVEITNKDATIEKYKTSHSQSQSSNSSSKQKVEKVISETSLSLGRERRSSIPSDSSSPSKSKVAVRVRSAGVEEEKEDEKEKTRLTSPHSPDRCGRRGDMSAAKKSLLNSDNVNVSGKNKQKMSEAQASVEFESKSKKTASSASVFDKGRNGDGDGSKDNGGLMDRKRRSQANEGVTTKKKEKSEDFGIGDRKACKSSSVLCYNDSDDNRDARCEIGEQNENAGGQETDVKGQQEKEVVGQVPGKNPNVSLINAVTLKATMTYLNQRSSGEKQLLNALGGKRPSNAVERRLAEEERRRVWEERSRDRLSKSRGKGRGGGDDESGAGDSGRGNKDGREKKGEPTRDNNVTNTIKFKRHSEMEEAEEEEDENNSGPKLSFEDMLMGGGGAEALLLTAKSSKSKLKPKSKSKSTHKQEEKSTKSVTDLDQARSTADKKSSDKKKNKDEGNRNRIASNEVKVRKVEEDHANRFPSKTKFEGVKVDESPTKSRRVRMKSFSDDEDSNSGARARIEKKSSSHTDEEKSRKIGTTSDLSQSKRNSHHSSDVLDSNSRFVHDKEETEEEKEEMGTTMRGGGNGVPLPGERVLDKFGLQVSHLSDKQSVRGHGRLPSQQSHQSPSVSVRNSTRSRMFDLPLDEAVAGMMGIEGGAGKVGNNKARMNRKEEKEEKQHEQGVGKGETVGVGGFTSGDGGISKRKGGRREDGGGGGGGSGLDGIGIGVGSGRGGSVLDGGGIGSGRGGSGVDGGSIPRGRAVAGKGKGIGKNRSGRLLLSSIIGARGGGDDDDDSNSNSNAETGSSFIRSTTAGGTAINSTQQRGQQQGQVRSVLASGGVTEAEILEYGNMTLDDLGSDFDDDDF